MTTTIRDTRKTGKLADLQPRDIVETEAGQRFIVLANSDGTQKLVFNLNTGLQVDNPSNDLNVEVLNVELVIS